MRTLEKRPQKIIVDKMIKNLITIYYFVLNNRLFNYVPVVILIIAHHKNLMYE